MSLENSLGHWVHLCPTSLGNGRGLSGSDASVLVLEEVAAGESAGSGLSMTSEDRSTAGDGVASLGIWVPLPSGSLASNLLFGQSWSGRFASAFTTPLGLGIVYLAHSLALSLFLFNCHCWCHIL